MGNARHSCALFPQGEEMGTAAGKTKHQQEQVTNVSVQAFGFVVRLGLAVSKHLTTK